ncbi:hypothetical protein C8F04DRAFT_1074622 [Mycena alexandri]|uniref:Uncharacterized protein n=1 Tax=Mycena alexandri TaxID=1745969 RepID=A0AAD6TCW3_9AGAR|nr:hypothetical protein C8F04DRAFT_1074622 [Mycena alexandri]
MRNRHKIEGTLSLPPYRRVFKNCTWQIESSARLSLFPSLLGLHYLCHTFTFRRFDTTHPCSVLALPPPVSALVLSPKSCYRVFLTPFAKRRVDRSRSLVNKGVREDSPLGCMYWRSPRCDAEGSLVAPRHQYNRTAPSLLGSTYKWTFPILKLGRRCCTDPPRA